MMALRISISFCREVPGPCRNLQDRLSPLAACRLQESSASLSAATGAADGYALRPLQVISLHSREAHLPLKRHRIYRSDQFNLPAIVAQDLCW